MKNSIVSKEMSVKDINKVAQTEGSIYKVMMRNKWELLGNYKYKIVTKCKQRIMGNK